MTHQIIFTATILIFAIADSFSVSDLKNWSHVIKIEGQLSQLNACDDNETSIVCVGENSIFSSNNRVLLVAKFSLSGQKLWVKYFDIKEHASGVAVKIGAANHIFILGNADIGGVPAASDTGPKIRWVYGFFLELDERGEEIKRLIFDHYEDSRFLTLDISSGDKFIGFGDFRNTPSDQMKTYLIEVNTAGNLKLIKHTPENKFNNISDIVMVDGGSFIAVGTASGEDNPGGLLGRSFRMSIEGDKIWEKKHSYGNGSVRLRSVDREGSEIAVVGEMVVLRGDYVDCDILAGKMDFDGNLSLNNIGFSQMRETVSDVTINERGEILTTGHTWDSSRRGPFVIGLDGNCDLKWEKYTRSKFHGEGLYIKWIGEHILMAGNVNGYAWVSFGGIENVNISSQKTLNNRVIKQGLVLNNKVLFINGHNELFGINGSKAGFDVSN